jgi:hypothetical protein
LRYPSTNAPKVREVLGPWLLSILAGQNRYGPVAGPRKDLVASALLGLGKIIADETVKFAGNFSLGGPIRLFNIVKL